MDRINDIIETKLATLNLDRGGDALVVNETGREGVYRISGDAGTNWLVGHDTDALGRAFDAEPVGSDAECMTLDEVLEALDELAAEWAERADAGI